MHLKCKNGTVAIIVAYNPEVDLLNSNLKVLEKQVDKIVIVNNGTEEIKITSIDESMYLVINNNENLGISKALNIGMEFAINYGYNYALLLDQDSTIADDAVEIMIQGFDNKKIAMVVPQIVYINGKPDKIDTNFDFNKVSHAITSGSLIDLNVINFISWGNSTFFNEDFFIDCVDFDFCLELGIKGYDILKSTKAKLYQRLGEMNEKKILIFSFYPSNHNKIRRYYITRNRLYMWKKYYKIQSKYVIKDIVYSLRDFGMMILFENDRKEKLKYLWRGIEDFNKKKVGKIG